MSSNRKSSRPTVAAVVLLIGTGASLVSAQTATPAPATAQPRQAAKNIKAAPAAQDPEEARLKKFLDKDGGYKDKHGGYYNPKAGTYTDEHGGVVDNWAGYTYKNGDYKSKAGDFWEASTKTFKLANGEVLKSDDTSNKEAIAVLRQTVEESGGYDKDLATKSMMTQIRLEHPLVPVKPRKPQ